MFELTSSKQQLLTPLLTVAGAVDKKQSHPILSNILMKLSDNSLTLTATDLEIKITALILSKSCEKKLSCKNSSTLAISMGLARRLQFFLVMFG